MTKQEKDMFNEILTVARTLQQENNQFRSDINKQIDSINNKVQKTFVPISLESDILRTAQLSISESIKTVLTNYNSPLQKLTEEVINEHSDQLKQLFTDSFNAVISTDEFKKSIVDAFFHKISRSLLSTTSSLFDNTVHELKHDSTFKAKAVIAIHNIVEDYMKESRLKEDKNA